MSIMNLLLVFFLSVCALFLVYISRPLRKKITRTRQLNSAITEIELHSKMQK